MLTERTTFMKNRYIFQSKHAECQVACSGWAQRLLAGFPRLGLLRVGAPGPGRVPPVPPAEGGAGPSLTQLKGANQVHRVPQQGLQTLGPGAPMG